jgi:hypothetical protein
MIKAPWKAVDNTDNGVKIKIRRRLISMLNAPPSVLDCFAGEGKLYAECYKGMAYLGLDKKKITEGRNLLNIDNLKYLRSADLVRFNIFDLDAYGSPWHQFLIILKRRRIVPGERIVIFLTDGLQIQARLGDLPHGLKPYCGIPKAMRVPCLARHMDYIRSLVVINACKEAGIEIQTALIGNNPRKNMTYMGLMIQKK